MIIDQCVYKGVGQYSNRRNHGVCTPQFWLRSVVRSSLSRWEILKMAVGSMFEENTWMCKELVDDLVRFLLSSETNFHPKMSTCRYITRNDGYAPASQHINWFLVHCFSPLKGQDEWIPDQLQEALVEAITNEECRELQIGYIRDSHICAGTGMPNACSVSNQLPLFLLSLDYSRLNA